MDFLEAHLRDMSPDKKKLLLPVVLNPVFMEMSSEIIKEIKTVMLDLNPEAPDFHERYRLFHTQKMLWENWQKTLGTLLQEIER